MKLFWTSFDYSPSKAAVGIFGLVCHWLVLSLQFIAFSFQCSYFEDLQSVLLCSPFLFRLIAVFGILVSISHMQTSILRILLHSMNTRKRCWMCDHLCSSGAAVCLLRDTRQRIHSASKRKVSYLASKNKRMMKAKTKSNSNSNKSQQWK